MRIADWTTKVRRTVDNETIPTALRLVASVLLASACVLSGQAEPIVLLVGICEQPWMAADDWSPSAQTVTVSGPRTLVALGAWWDASFRNTPPPNDGNGKFLNAISTTL